MPITLSLVVSQLPKGWAKLVAEKHGLKEDTVRKIAKGVRHNVLVFNTLSLLAEDHKKMTDQLHERLRKINQPL